MLKLMDSHNTPIILEDGVSIRPATSWEQKYGYKGEVYFIYGTAGEKLAVSDYFYAKAAFEVAVKNNKLKEFGMELDGKYFQYNIKTGCWEFDCVLNPTIMRYSITYFNYEYDEPGVAHRATFVEARDFANKNFGTVRCDETHHEVYFKSEPYWD